jgi:hypothetical protein
MDDTERRQAFGAFLRTRRARLSHRKWACQRATDDAHQDYGAKK